MLRKDKLEVLYLEDMEQDVEILRQKLMDDLNCPVYLDWTATEKEYIDFIKNKTYDLILADYTLPGYNAEQALKAALTFCPQIPFICISGTIGEDVAVELLKQGATDYVLKDRLGRLSFAVTRAINQAVEKAEYECALRISEESCRLMLDSTNDGIAMLDRDGVIINANLVFEKRFGKTNQEMNGINFKDLTPMHQKLNEERMQHFKNVFETGDSEIFDDTRDGITFYNRCYPIFADGKVTAIALFSTDITDRKKAEEEAIHNAELRVEAEILQKREREYLEILEGSTEGSWIYNFQEDKIELSPRCLWLMGEEGVPSKNPFSHIESFIDPDSVRLAKEQYNLVLDKKSPKYVVECRLTTGQWFLVQGKVVYEENGIPIKIYGTIMDITDRKKAEMALRQSEADLSRTAEELSLKNKFITDFFTNITHELKTPLSIILAQNELMGYYLNDKSKILELIAKSTQNSYRLFRIINNLLDISKIDAGYMKVDLEDVDVLEIIENVCKSVESYAKALKIDLTYRPLLHSKVIPTDIDKLERILLNLLSNAIKFTQAHGQIVVSVEDKKDGGIIISVEDTGEGIPEEKVELIFDRFSQVDSTLARRTEGCGIGLALVKSLVEMMGGRISVKSKLGVGSNFTVEIPLLNPISDSRKINVYGLNLVKKTEMELSDLHDRNNG